MPTNFYMFFVAGIIPMIIGSVYYSDMLFGKAWKKANKITDDDLAGGNMFLIFGLAYVFSVIASFALSGIVIHQNDAFQMMIPQVLESGSEAQKQFIALMTEYGDQHRNFKHGALHGGIITVFFVLPIIAINALFERRGAKYVLIHFGYWFITLILMGGLLCQTLEYPSLT